MTRIIMIILAELLFAVSLMSQDTTWQMTLSGGQVISNVEMKKLNDDSLIISNVAGNRSIPVEIIIEIRLVKEGYFWKGAKTGALIGAAIGGVTGAIAGANAKPSPGTLFGDIDKTTLHLVAVPLGAIVYGAMFGVIGGVIGGPIGAMYGVDEVYDLSNMALRGKLSTIQSILTKYKE